VTVVVRRLAEADLPAAAAIYNHAVRHTDATLDTEERTVEAARCWLDEHSGRRYPALGGFLDGELAGYGTLSPFARRPGYRASGEISVYVAPDRQRRGVGRALCAALTAHAEAVGLSTVLAIVTSTNDASRRLFTTAGYSPTGTMRCVGYKLGRLVDLDILQLVFPGNLARYDGAPLDALTGDEEPA
jgi:phosphinothricin acetyltransferase